MSDFLQISFRVTPDGNPYVNFDDESFYGSFKRINSEITGYEYDDIRFDSNDSDDKFRIVLDELFCVHCQAVCFCYYDIIGLYRFSDMSNAIDLERMYDLWYETVIE